jgi:hypothetical protein
MIHMIINFAGHADYANVLPYQRQPSPPGPNATQRELQKVRDPKSDQSSINKKVVVTGTQTETALTLPLVEGSRVQIPCNSPSEPFRYGVIRWIGDVPAIQGLVAGIELVSYKYM